MLAQGEYIRLEGHELPSHIITVFVASSHAGSHGTAVGHCICLVDEKQLTVYVS